MSLLGRIRSRLSIDSSETRSDSAVAEAERLLRSGGSVEDIRRAAGLIRADSEVNRAWKALFLGDLDAALEWSYAAASARPYDVDSRIVHGAARLARNELDHAEHEFDAVIEEFGADSEAADGRRATILARGFAPLDELPAADVEWEAAATLLTTLWRLSGVDEERLSGLRDAHKEGMAIIKRALERERVVD